MTFRRLCALSAAALLFVAVGCGGDDTASETGTDAANEPVQLLLDWYPNADHAGIFAAAGEGFFAEQGLAVTPTVPSDAAAALKEVGAGKAPFAISYEPEVLLARAQGVPVVAVGALVTHPLNSILVRADSGIESPRDLEGKVVGQAGLPLDRPLLDTVVEADGGDPAAVETRNVGFNLAPALASGRVDAIVGAYWNIESVDLAEQGIETRAFRLEEHGVPDYDELVLVTGDRIAADRPELVEAMLAGLRRGQDWAATDQSGAVEHLVEANPDLDPGIVSEQIALTADLLSPPDGETLDMSRDEWAAFATWMRENGLLEGEVDVDEAMTTRFLPPGRE
ncbi:MAG: ABC transporter substrate-binding protein [Thermoleophilia bacterium]|jgi:putative hydroxymethylpyrimidine transport system substrate-binding protein